MPEPTPLELHHHALNLLGAQSGAPADPALALDILAGETIADGKPSSDTHGEKLAYRWATELLAFENFATEHGRTPRESAHAGTIPHHERRLAGWARYQRRFPGRLSRFQLARLEVSPAFRWDPQEAAWFETLAECNQFLGAAGRLPRLHQANPVEKRLARWLNRQLRYQRSGTLPQKRTAAIDLLLQSAHKN